MSSNDQLRNQHLMWRAGFGPAVGQLADIEHTTPQHLYRSLQKSSAKSPAYLQAADNYLQGLMMGFQEIGRQQRQEMSADQRKEMLRKSREGIKSLNLYWLNEMVNSDAQLREKMSLFWHGHFACRNLNVFFQQELLDVIRRNALGNFRDLLHEVSKTGAMLNFLNNNQNRKDHPNENFAREVMELFTLGRGNYGEEDIKQAARAFTGWGANAKGEFVFRRFQHDDGSKTLLGKTGNFDGDDVLDILLNEKQTAQFITKKIYRFFVNDVVDDEKTNWLAARFYQSGYNIGQLLDDIFMSDWFYEEKNIGVRIKSPVELLVGLQRMLPMKLQNDETLLLLERVLGQVLFYPPNVAGWPGGKNWIDSSTLMMRMRIPQLISDQDDFNIKPKSDDDQMMGRNDDDTKIKMGKGAAPISAAINWTPYTGHYANVPRADLVNDLAAGLLQTKKTVSANIISQFSMDDTKDNFIRTATIQIMSTPEYQLC